MSLESSEGRATLEGLYRELILDHFRHPHHHDEVAQPDLSVVGHNPLCGDDLVLQVKFNGQGKVERIGVQSRGCSISTASGSMMTDVMMGRSKAEAIQLCGAMKRMMQGEAPSEELGDAEALEGVKKFPTRVKCALLPWTTLEEGLEKHQGGSP